MNQAATRPPSLDKLLESQALRELAQTHGRASALAAAREALDAWRADTSRPFDSAQFEQRCRRQLEQRAALNLRPVFNLTGTVLHTNLGRALLPQEAIDAVTTLMGQAGNLEYDLASGLSIS